MKEIQKKIKREFDVICYTRDHFEMMHTQKLVVERMYKKYTHTHTHTHNTTQHNTTQHNTTQHTRTHTHVRALLGSRPI